MHTKPVQLFDVLNLRKILAFFAHSTCAFDSTSLVCVRTRFGILPIRIDIGSRGVHFGVLV